MHPNAIRVVRDYVHRCLRTAVDLAHVTRVEKPYGGKVTVQVVHTGNIRELVRRVERAPGDEDLSGPLLWNLQQGVRYR